MFEFYEKVHFLPFQTFAYKNGKKNTKETREKSPYILYRVSFILILKIILDQISKR